MDRKLTLLIPCKNEHDNLGPCIASAREVADEVLVADSGSNDGTLELARELGCRVIEREYGTSGDFKNWAIPQAAYPWVLLLDADERATPELRDEIRHILEAPRHDGYWIYRLNHLMGHPIHYGAWGRDKVLRLFRRDLGRYQGPTDHAEVEVEPGTTGVLEHRLVHFTCWSYAQYLPKIERYADVQAGLWHAQGRRATWNQLLFRGPLRFLQSYFLQLGFLDGTAGLQVSAFVGYLSYLKQARLWEMERARSRNDLDATDCFDAYASPQQDVDRDAA